MITTLQGVANDVITIKATITELKDAITSVKARLDEAENSIRM